MNKQYNHIPVKITYQEAQALGSLYSPLNSNERLYSDLNRTLASFPSDYVPDGKIRQLYTTLLYNYYPNEATIKAAFSNQFFFNSHKHVVIYELNAGNSRVDICKINGKSIAYEIKTDLDNFHRLSKQIQDYKQLFEEVFVICSEARYHEAVQFLPSDIGIYTYYKTRQNNYRFTISRPSCLNGQFLNSKYQLSTLTKADIRHCCPDGMNDKEQMIQFILENQSSAQINQLYKNCIKHKYNSNWDFLFQNHQSIIDLDYQWFFQNKINPELIYQ